MTNEITSKKLFNQLKEEIKGKKGHIYFNMGDVCLKIVETDTVGKTLQEWLREYLKVNNYYFREPKNTQEFPDFFLSSSNTENMLEIKSFNYSNSPAFDIANFDSYCANIKEKPYCLYADYLIFGYTMTNGTISIENLWLKKIWEISGTSARYPLKTQIKKDMIYNIRPNSDFKNGEDGVFKNENKFLTAVYKTIEKYTQDTQYAQSWKKTLNQNYKKYYGKYLEF